MASEINVERVESILGYNFRNKSLLTTALTAPHRNGLEIGGAETTDGNRRLATLGDGVLRLIIAKDWYLAGLAQGGLFISSLRTRGDTDCVVTLTDMLINSASNVRLCNLATQAGIGSCLYRSPRLENITIAPNTLILAMKAIVGACWLDCGEDMDYIRVPLRALGSVRSFQR